MNLNLSPILLDGREVDDILRGTNEKFLWKSLCHITTALDPPKTRVVMLTSHALYEFKVDPTVWDIHGHLPVIPPTTKGLNGLPSTNNKHTVLPPYPPAAESISMSRLKKRKEWISMHSCENDDDGNPNSFSIHFFSGSVGSQAALGFSKMKRLISFGTAFDEFLKIKKFLCTSPLHAVQFKIIIQRAMRDSWQKLFEQSIIPSPEIFQRHAFVMKKAHNRVLVISNKWIYNVDATVKPFAIKSVKWSLPIASITELKVSSSSNKKSNGNSNENNKMINENNPFAIIHFNEKVVSELMDEIHVSKEFKSSGGGAGSSGSGNGSGKDSSYGHSWIFRTTSERDKILQTIQQLYAKETAGQIIPIKSIEPQNAPSDENQND